MRISDWSSDVCSSDLTNANAALDRIYRKPPSIHQRRCAHVKRGDFVAPFADHRRCYKQAYLTPVPFPAVTNSCQCHLLEVAVVGPRFAPSLRTTSAAISHETAPHRPVAHQRCLRVLDEHPANHQSLKLISYADFSLTK